MTDQPRHAPLSLVLVHGAGSGPWVYDGWDNHFPGITVHAIDLQQGLDVNKASHDDYARKVAAAVSSLPGPTSLCGWSMGGLVVLQATLLTTPHSVVLLEASAPAEVQGTNPDTERVDGSFDPEVVYGPFPDGMRARPESTRARGERKRGISVPTLPYPSLVVSSDDFPDERGTLIAQLYGSAPSTFPRPRPLGPRASQQRPSDDRELARHRSVRCLRRCTK